MSFTARRAAHQPKRVGDESYFAAKRSATAAVEDVQWYFGANRARFSRRHEVTLTIRPRPGEYAGGAELVRRPITCV